MNKIILQIGLLIFFFSLIYFMQRGLPVERVLIISFAIFMVLTCMFSIIVIGIIKAINKNSFNKMNDYSDNLAGNKKNE
jgi:hypothetical protein